MFFHVLTLVVLEEVVEPKASRPRVQTASERHG